jgi:hypothetical protein
MKQIIEKRGLPSPSRRQRSPGKDYRHLFFHERPIAAKRFLRIISLK